MSDKQFPTAPVTPDLSEEALRKAYPDSFLDPHMNPDPEARAASYGQRMGAYTTPKGDDVLGKHSISPTVRVPYASKATVELKREMHWRRFKRSFTRVDRWFRVAVAWRQAAESLGQCLKFTWKLWTRNYTV